MRVRRGVHRASSRLRIEMSDPGEALIPLPIVFGGRFWLRHVQVR